MPRFSILIVTSGLLFFLAACINGEKKAESLPNIEVPTIFSLLSPDQSGITFSNDLTEDSVINYFTYPYLYMGGGVAIGDLNNDDLPDIYFTGNMVENKLYLNSGNLQFEDITQQAKVGADNRWVTGVTMADVNADGWLDIYVSVSGKFATTRNLLYLNDGKTDDGIPTFTESAEKSGIADEGRSTQGVFFDYDKDGDLDLYVANYPFMSFKTRNFSYQYLIEKKQPEHSDKLYQNQGDGTFVDVTKEAGLLNFGLSLSATVGDVNADGWEDIYVSNDFATPDFFYLNNGDGTFSEKIQEATQHTAFFGMGADIADINNDGLLDILQMDMTPADNRRNKANMASMNITAFWEIVNMGMHYQYMQNALQLNNGITPDGIPHFSDIARFAGLSSTDWSWTGLMADLDNDGNKDVFITNGTRRDINNKDYFNKIENASYKIKKELSQLELSLNIPSERIDNYAFKNLGDLSFSPVIKEWGLSYEGFSNGAAYADLDNDGDLDMIINNIDDVSLIYQNKTSEMELANFLRVSFKGSEKNPLGIGTKVVVKNKGEVQYQYLTTTRGFQSSVEPILHFGLDEETQVEDVFIEWPDGKQQSFRNVSANQVITVDHQESKTKLAEPSDSKVSKQWFTDVSDSLGIDHRHIENYYDDFEREVLIPHGYSRMGPGLAVGDVNGDQLEDFYVGGAIGSSGALYLQNSESQFTISDNSPWDSDRDKEDIGASLFDADGDGDLDLYVVSGGNENEEGSANLQDRLYINIGLGNFEKAQNSLPKMQTSGSRVIPGDYDKDGDLDLFIGGRIVPGSYPLPARSYILRNDGLINGEISFVDVTESVSPFLMKAGMVTDAVWVDFDQDNQLDLVVVGEWMPITFLKNDGNVFYNQTQKYDLEKSNGWWYSIIAGDFDKDGDMDFVAGNLGLNYKYSASKDASFDVYAYDYDRNGKLDIVLGYYNDGVQFPLRGKQCSSEQIPAIGIKYKDYNSFAGASLADIYTEEDLEASLHYQAWTFASSYIQNKGSEGFELRNLPNPVQLSSVNKIVSEDINLDGHLDLILAGNLFSSEIETPRNDASYGQVLLGNGKGDFQHIPYSQSGFFLKYDTKDLAKIHTSKGNVILSGNNNDFVRAIKLNNPQKPSL